MTSTTHSARPPRGRAALDDLGVQLVLGRSGVYEALALGFAYPSAASLERLGDLIADLAGHPVTRTYGLGPRLAAIEAAVEGAAVDDLQLEHNALFLGQVLCSPHETEYERDTFSKAAQLADIAGFYNAWGLQTSEVRRTMPDFIGTEFDFMAMLTRRQAYASIRGWANRRKVAAQSAEAFLQTHLGRWVNAFAADVREASSDTPAGQYFEAIARLCEQFVVMDIAAVGVLPSTLQARIMRPEDAEAMKCLFEDPMAVEGEDSVFTPPPAEIEEIELPEFPSFE